MELTAFVGRVTVSSSFELPVRCLHLQMEMDAVLLAQKFGEGPQDTKGAYKGNAMRH